jgi:hypothetical protein
MFMENNDPKPAVELIRRFTRIYPYEAGGVGTSIAEFLSGKARLGRVNPAPETVFHEGSGKVMNTVPPRLPTTRCSTTSCAGAGHSLDRADGPTAAIGIIGASPSPPCADEEDHGEAPRSPMPLRAACA